MCVLGFDNGADGRDEQSWCGGCGSVEVVAYFAGGGDGWDWIWYWRNSVDWLGWRKMRWVTRRNGSVVNKY